MIRKILDRLRFYKRIRIFIYLYLNYFCKAVIRIDKSRIIPYKGAVIDIDPTARIYLSGGDVEVGCDRLKGSKEETRVRLRQNAIWSTSKGCRLSYGITLEVLREALLETKFFSMNSNSTLITAEKISLGHDVMIGRNVVIYDSDFHSILDEDGNTVNPPRPVEIGDHVWIGTNAVVIKGSTIGNGSIIAAGTMIHGDVDEHTIIRTEHNNYVSGYVSRWDRKAPVN